MQIGVLAEVGQRLAVGVAVEFKVVGLLCRGEESVGREEPRVPQGALARERRDVSRERRRRLLRERTRLRLRVVVVVPVAQQKKAFSS